MKKLFFILVILPFLSKGQNNLILNGDFEQYTSCPDDQGQIENALYWINPNEASPDYWHVCSTGGTTIPNNGFGFQNAHSGQAFAGIYGFSYSQPNGREYIQSELTDSIIKDIPYQISFYINLVDKSRFAITTLGAYLSIDSISSNDMERFEFIPQILNDSTNLLDDRVNWVLITDTFISSIGGEKYITIGNFAEAGESDTTRLDSGVYLFSYYYIDDVSVISLDTTIGIEENESIKFEIYPNPAKESIVIETELREQTMVKLFDVTGREVLTTTLAANKTTIDVSGFAAGIYTAVLLRDDVAVGRKKIIVE